MNTQQGADSSGGGQVVVETKKPQRQAELLRLHLFGYGTGTGGAIDLTVSRERKRIGLQYLGRLLGYQVRWTLKRPGAIGWGRARKSRMFATELEAQQFAEEKWEACRRWLQNRQPSCSCPGAIVQ